MIKLVSGNVLLTPSHRKQLTAWLKRCSRLGKRLGKFVITITLRRVGRYYETRAVFSPASASGGCQSFDCRTRQQNCLHAFRDLVRDLTVRIHNQCLQRTLAT